MPTAGGVARRRQHRSVVDRPLSDDVRLVKEHARSLDPPDASLLDPCVFHCRKFIYKRETKSASPQAPDTCRGVWQSLWHTLQTAPHDAGKDFHHTSVRAIASPFTILISSRTRRCIRRRASFAR